jgi:transcriptional regulator with XRE-family HTH domain
LNKQGRLGTFLRVKREKLGLSQRQVADIFNLTSPQFISNFERGLCAIPFPMLRKLSQVYRISPQILKRELMDDYRADLKEIFKEEPRSDRKR